ncbi:complement factor H-related protein 1-like isoform X2 [Xiphias gladius]|uniref:complement factor H-related protein 1-like isoform X2 n=1 Tax=Xiphias gladius TaxID=8245 RepID=UPI001A97EE42|nr:complement factor H-related protein 1-like isoform X2 [Xiphias gladius]
MTMRYLGFVLLVCFPGVLHAQSAAQPCRAPRLVGGYFVPVQETYSHGTKLAYACENGQKLTVEGWWATSTCQKGTWSHKPQCIDENACIPPTLANAKYTENSNGWYVNGDIIRTTCDKGYEHKDRVATARCINGIWSSLPICEKSSDTCSEPPKIPHAVIIHQDYQEVFAADSELHYECEDGYTVEGEQAKQSIFCIAGNWTEGPKCSSVTEPGTGHGGSAQGGKDWGPTTSASSGTWPIGGGSSIGSGLNEREIQTQISPINNCGKHPTIYNGDVSEIHPLFLKYQCNSFYKQVGPEEVVCYTDGTWSEVPTCKAAYCFLDTHEYPYLKPAGVKYIKDGHSVTLECVRLRQWWTDHYSLAQCTNGRIKINRCCSWMQMVSVTPV